MIRVWQCSPELRERAVRLKALERENYEATG